MNSIHHRRGKTVKLGTNARRDQSLSYRPVPVCQRMGSIRYCLAPGLIRSVCFRIGHQPLAALGARGNLAHHHAFIWPAFQPVGKPAVWRLVVGKPRLHPRLRVPEE